MRRRSGQTSTLARHTSARRSTNTGTLPAPPTPPAGYLGWWDASQITGVADGAALATWNDLSVQGHTLSQATGAAQPTFYKTTGAKLVNGLPAVWFDGTDDLMNTAIAGWTITQPFTVAVVVQMATSSVMPWAGGNGATFPYLYNDVANKAELNAGGANQEVGPVLGTGLHALVSVLNAAASSVNIDGTIYTVAATPGGSGWTNGFAVGAYTGGAFFVNGPICEVLVYGSALTPTVQATLYSYLHTKWATP